MSKPELIMRRIRGSLAHLYAELLAVPNGFFKTGFRREAMVR